MRYDEPARRKQLTMWRSESRAPRVSRPVPVQRWIDRLHHRRPVHAEAEKFLDAAGLLHGGAEKFAMFAIEDAEIFPLREPRPHFFQVRLQMQSHRRVARVRTRGAAAFEHFLLRSQDL